jgi:fatty-acyl-CoA synthase
MAKRMSEVPNNIGNLIELRTSKAPGKMFLFSEPDGRTFSYAEFDAAVNRAAALLASHAISKGDVFSLLMPTSAEYIIGYFTCWKLGGIAVYELAFERT